VTKINEHGLKDQLEYYVRVECLTDRESAQRLHLATSTVNAWRKRLGLPVAQSWRRRFARAYAAQGGEVQLRTMVEAGATGAAIARHFGFRRQWGSKLRAKVLAERR
jgi:hypothetical protein